MSKLIDKKVSPANPIIKKFNKFPLPNEESEKKLALEQNSNISSLNTSETPISNIKNNEEINKMTLPKNRVKQFEEILLNLDENDFQGDAEKNQNNIMKDNLINAILNSEKDPVSILNELGLMLKSPININIRTEINNNMQT